MISRQLSEIVPRDEQLRGFRREISRAVAFRLSQEGAELTAAERNALESRLSALRKSMGQDR